MTDRRRRLLKLLANIEQLIAEAEEIAAGGTDDEILSQTLNQMTELRAAWERTQRLLNQPEGEQRPMAHSAVGVTALATRGRGDGRSILIVFGK